MDVVKSRLQADGVYLNKYKGVLDCISQSYQKEGLKVSPSAVMWGQCQSLEGGLASLWGHMRLQRGKSGNQSTSGHHIQHYLDPCLI